MGEDRAAQPVSLAVKDILEAATGGLPDLMRVINSQILPSEMAKFGASSVISPGIANLQADIYDTAGRRMNEIGNEITRANAAADAQTLEGPGFSVVSALKNLQDVIDPEVARVRSATGNAITDRITKGISGSEEAGIERYLNRERQMSGTGNVRSNTEVTKGALNFGQAGRTALDNALMQANTFLQTGRSGVDTFKVATGKSSNMGDARFTGVQSPGNDSANLGSNLLGQAGQIQNTGAQINANRSSAFQNVVGALPDY